MTNTQIETSKLEKYIIMDIEFLKTQYLYDTELMNHIDSKVFFRTYAYGIDVKRLNVLKRNGYKITSIYPRESKEGSNAPRLEINLNITYRGLEN